MSCCCCCSYVTCADVWRKMRRSSSADDDQNCRSIRMDIALLKEQYNSIQDKQRRETRVVCFKKAVNSEEICGKNFINRVPVSPDKQSLSEASVLETQFSCVEGSDNDSWHTHLDMYPLTNHTSDCSDVTDVAASTDDSSTDSSEHLSQHSDNLERNQHLRNMPVTGSVLYSRTLSSPAVLIRQLSFRSYRSSPTPAGVQNYPFPQVKGFKKSETARRLGLYSSF